MRPLHSLPTVHKPLAEFDRESRNLTERAERWVAAMSGVLAQQPTPKLPVLPSDAPPAPAAPPVSWQGGVEGLTQPSGATAAAATEGLPHERLLMTLDAGDLGQLSFAVEQSSDGIRVIIGADGRNAQTAVGAERETLLAALRAAGLPTQSVTVVSTAKLGTVLAQASKVPREGDQHGPEPRDPRGRSGRRVKFTG